MNNAVCGEGIPQISSRRQWGRSCLTNSHRHLQRSGWDENLPIDSCLSGIQLCYTGYRRFSALYTVETYVTAISYFAS